MITSTLETSEQAPSETSHAGLRVTPSTPAIGAVVEGVDLAGPLDAHFIARLAALLAERQVLFVRGQQLDASAQCALAARFGRLALSPLQRLVGSTRPYSVIEDTAERRPAGFDWHTDLSWTATPPHIGILHALEVPECGGDTMWASGAAAYEALAPADRDRAVTLQLVHQMDASYLETVARHHGAVIAARLVAEHPPIEHPLVRRHPLTGRPALWMSKLYHVRISGVSDAESERLLAVYEAALLDPEVQVRWRWEPGDVAIWDETSTCHRALADHFPQLRRVRRCTTEGGRPLGLAISFEPELEA